MFLNNGEGVYNMSAMKIAAVRYIEQLPESKMNSAVDYLRFLYEQEYPPDDYDYFLAKRADNDMDNETISFDEVLNELGISRDELHSN